MSEAKGTWIRGMVGEGEAMVRRQSPTWTSTALRDLYREDSLWRSGASVILVNNMCARSGMRELRVAWSRVETHGLGTPCGGVGEAGARKKPPADFQSSGVEIIQFGHI